MDFTAYPTYDRYRTLRLTTPQQRGYDVYALQTALIRQGFNLPQFGADGYFGKECDAAVRAAQKANGLVVDGLAGGKTQEALAVKISQGYAVETGVPAARLYGSMSHESGFRLGNYSDQRDDGSYDAGVTQRNTRLTPAQEGFTVPESIEALAKRTKQYYVLFEGLATDRRWDLAQGAWNAPAYACYIAKEEGAHGVPTNQTAKPGVTARATFEAYVASVSAYA